jgi:glycerol kinase
MGGIVARDLILVLDQGTTGSKAIVFDPQGKQVARGYAKLPLQFPKTDWVEAKVEDVKASLQQAVSACLAQVDVKRLSFVGVTNQRETCTLFHGETGEALYPFIVWQDRRTRQACARLPESFLAEKTGLRAHPYFSASKIAWMLSHLKPSPKTPLKFMTIDTYVCYVLSGEKVHVTDPTNASRTLLYNIHQNRWDEDLCRLFEIPQDCLPQVIPNGERVGETSGALGIPAGIPIVAPLGDQQAAWVGCGATYRPTLKMTLGTGSFAIGPSADQAFERGLLQTIGYHSKDKKLFGYEAVVFCSGIVTEWLKNLGWIHAYEELNAIPFPPTTEALFFPLFTDMGTPYWKPARQGAGFGHLQLKHSQKDLLQAVMLGVVFQNMLALEQYTLSNIDVLYLDGGMSQIEWVQNMMSLMMHRPVANSDFPDMTCLGVWVDIMRHHFRPTDENMMGIIQRTFQNPGSQRARQVSESDHPKLRALYEQWRQSLQAAMG